MGRGRFRWRVALLGWSEDWSARRRIQGQTSASRLRKEAIERCASRLFAIHRNRDHRDKNDQQSQRSLHVFVQSVWEYRERINHQRSRHLTFTVGCNHHFARVTVAPGTTSSVHPRSSVSVALPQPRRDISLFKLLRLLEFAANSGATSTILWLHLTGG